METIDRVTNGPRQVRRMEERYGSVCANRNASRRCLTNSFATLQPARQT